MQPAKPQPTIAPSKALYASFSSKMRYLIALLTLLTAVNAQFGGFFDQMFGGGGGNGNPHEAHQQGSQQAPNNPSDASLFRQRYEHSNCDKFLCPDTLACVHFPHHCPCAFDSHQEKFELAEGQRICVSRSGFKPGETARKIELARKGLL
ncbi:unnamed protein product [Clonostachys rosea f. rosea IK726]|uniref:Uncharacterized protein n=1 Tax=Clonostachys rosea f. rosea IK726 TaxID=1349383 RepID=A0ACA9TUA0_BIOOC|nr:unnamed protein product [Clonostachys rosea f. rosea IK726]